MKLTLFHTGGLEIVLFYVMFLKPIEFSFAFENMKWQLNHTGDLFQMVKVMLSYKMFEKGRGTFEGITFYTMSACNLQSIGFQIGDGFKTAQRYV